MKFPSFKRSILAAAIMGVCSAIALPQIPVPAPPPLPGLDVRIATGRPPALRHERRGHRPGADYVWVGGFWHWDDGRWRWVTGRWEPPAAAGAYWVAPRYAHSGRAYIYEPGHWSNQTVVVGDEVRQRPEWRRHEHEHERELEREQHRDRDRDRGEDRDREHGDREHE